MLFTFQVPADSKHLPPTDLVLGGELDQVEVVPGGGGGQGGGVSSPAGLHTGYGKIALTIGNSNNIILFSNFQFLLYLSGGRSMQASCTRIRVTYWLSTATLGTASLVFTTISTLRQRTAPSCLYLTLCLVLLKQC